VFTFLLVSSIINKILLPLEKQQRKYWWKNQSLGHRFKVRGARFKGDVRGKLFLHRVVGAWNSLPGEVVEADTIVTFKGWLDKYMNRMGIVRFVATPG